MANQTITPASLISAAEFGAPAITYVGDGWLSSTGDGWFSDGWFAPRQTITSTGLTTTAELGNLIVRAAPRLSPISLVGQAVLGQSCLNLVVRVTSLTTTSSWGTTRLNCYLSPIGLSNTAIFGGSAFIPGKVKLNLVGLLNSSVLGNNILQSGPVSLTPTAVTTTTAFGTHILQILQGENLYVLPVSLDSTATLGQNSLLPGEVNINPASLLFTSHIGDSRLGMHLHPASFLAGPSSTPNEGIVLGTPQLNRIIRSGSLTEHAQLGHFRVSYPQWLMPVGWISIPALGSCMLFMEVLLRGDLQLEVAGRALYEPVNRKDLLQVTSPIILLRRPEN